MNDTVAQDDARRRDVFVSHASEDKDAIARPLTDALIRRGFSVWFDEHELIPGDSLRRRIGQGLRDARIGVVILSRPFFAKEWTQWELDGLTARQMNGENNVIVPVWHGVDKADVAAHSPPLADLVAIPSELGVEAIVDGVARRLGRESVPASAADLRSVSTIRSRVGSASALTVVASATAASALRSGSTGASQHPSAWRSRGLMTGSAVLTAWQDTQPNGYE